ncbi:kinase-like domain-containing protein [Corynascus novoguineensis]|uniref:Kinase-like domain-containing protein n=1 Tax=Corynascus novoguineensis TaxID=1126955 RepID=A0AAN7CJG8_9PEZI|nr:kinase-like domain-containing protein [Corynascus novoguineensis]
MVNQQYGDITVTVHDPSGEVTPVRQHLVEAAPKTSSYMPPSRERIAEVVKECETTLKKRPKCPRGESFVGALLRAASRALELYWDGTTESNKTFFPHALLVEVLTKDRIQSSLDFSLEAAKSYTPEECYRRIRGSGAPNELGEYARVFTVLLLCDVPRDIFEFFSSEPKMSDEAFPFKLGKDGGSIRSKSWGASIPDFQPAWTSQCCESFASQQWRVFLPCFKDTEAHHNFDGDTIMPWHDYHVPKGGSSTSSTYRGTDAPAGGNSVVSRVFIHDGHWSFNGLNPAPGDKRVVTFAVKKLITENEEDFKREVAMLRQLGGKRLHTVKLLATFRHGRTYSLLFPWAECDLLKYWERDTGHRDMSPPLILWVANQCHGLLEALHWIHVPDSTVSDPENQPLYGRHGDIKPENILWYKHNADGLHPLASGELVLSDFGLSSLNHDQSRSKVKNGDFHHTTTYAPPESVLPDNFISRSIDIWALGCVYLEFITWIVGGSDFVNKFQRARRSPFLGYEIWNDIFWEVRELEVPTAGNQQHVTIVKPAVEEWIKTLRKKPEATRFIQDFLDIIANHMLVTNKTDRATVGQLLPMFDAIKANCGRDISYYTSPSTNSGSAVVARAPAAQTLSIKAQESIRRASRAIPRYTGQVQVRPQRTGATHLKP